MKQKNRIAKKSSILGKKAKNNFIQGITLISLVITIILLIILAAVGINLGLGENGLFSKAKYAKEKYVNSQTSEEKQINELDEEINQYVGELDVFKKILELCKIKGEYKVEDLATNKDGILTTILQNDKSINYIVNNEDIFLDILTNSEISVSEIVESEKMKEKVAGNLEWANKIIQKGATISNFHEKCDTIPKMTSNEDSVGQIIVEATDYRVKPYNIFDKDRETYWLSETVSSEPSNAYIIYKYNKSHSIYKIDIDTRETTNGTSDNTLVLYISEKEQGEDSWVKIYEESYSLGNSQAGKKRNITCKLDKVTNIRRIKVDSLTHCTSNNWWCSRVIEEIRIYGI